MTWVGNEDDEEGVNLLFPLFGPSPGCSWAEPFILLGAFIIWFGERCVPGVQLVKGAVQSCGLRCHKRLPILLFSSFQMLDSLMACMP
jgi:hypothetical protein